MRWKCEERGELFCEDAVQGSLGEGVPETTRMLRPHWIAAALFFVAALPYVRTLGYEYVWDDLQYLVEPHPYRGRAGVVRALCEPFFLIPAYYRPLAALSFTLSPSAVVQHGINVLLHALNTVLVFLCARALMPREAAESRWVLWAPAFGALVFAVHPAAVEPVAWVSGRFDTLMCCFVLACSLAALTGEATARRQLLVFVLFFAALCSKESAMGLPVALPFMLLLKSRLAGEGIPAKRQCMQMTRLWVAMGLAVALYAAVRLMVMPVLLPASNSAEEAVFGAANLSDKFNVMALAVTEFAKLLLNPWSHSAPLHPLHYEKGGALLGQTVVVMVAILLLLVLAAMKKPKVNFPLALLAALAMSWPALHVMDMYNRDNIISDRYALAPLALLLSGLFATVGVWLTRRKPAANAGEKRVLVYAGVFGLLCVAALAAHTHATIPLWRNEGVLWAFVHRQVPQSGLAYANYIGALMKKGRWHEANDELKRFRHEHPDAVASTGIAGINDWMLVHVQAGDHASALEVFALVEHKYRDVAPDTLKGKDARSLGRIYRFRGMLEGEAGRWHEAASYLEKSVHISPDDVDNAFPYAYALFMTGQKRLADEVFGRALDVAPDVAAEKAKEWRRTWVEKEPLE